MTVLTIYWGLTAQNFILIHSDVAFLLYDV